MGPRSGVPFPIASRVELGDQDMDSVSQGILGRTIWLRISMVAEPLSRCFTTDHTVTPAKEFHFLHAGGVSKWVRGLSSLDIAASLEVSGEKAVSRTRPQVCAKASSSGLAGSQTSTPELVPTANRSPLPDHSIAIGFCTCRVSLGKFSLPSRLQISTPFPVISANSLGFTGFHLHLVAVEVFNLSMSEPSIPDRRVTASRLAVAINSPPGERSAS